MNWFLNDMKGIWNMLSFAFRSIMDCFVGLWNDGIIKSIILLCLAVFFLFLSVTIYIDEGKDCLFLIIFCLIMFLFFFIYYIYQGKVIIDAATVESVSSGDVVLYLISGKGVFI